MPAVGPRTRGTALAEEPDPTEPGECSGVGRCNRSELTLDPTRGRWGHPRSPLLTVSVAAAPPAPAPAMLIGSVRGGARNSGTFATEAASDDELLAWCWIFGMGGLGRDMDTVLAGGAASNSENRRNMFTALFKNASFTDDHLITRLACFALIVQPAESSLQHTRHTDEPVLTERTQ